VAPPHHANDDDLETIIHEEIDRSILEPQHPKGDVEVVILKPERKAK
jgi:hypothetical protein